ncbi:MAG: hypothetical protein L0196_08640 [candidate division Zixibacteria bacterium]|nr:hypothetical protein [candidate division Zixibacteria bacterium]
MNRVAKILFPLLLASFLFSHCEVFSIVAHGAEKAAGQTCVNPNCCCDHGGPEGKVAVCGMCTAPSANPNILTTDQCCLYQANCDPKSGLPLLSVNKDLQPVKTVNRILNFAAVSIFHSFENQIQIFDFKPAVFHPPQN